MPRLGRAFYSRYTPRVARDLVGSVLVRKLDGRVLSGRVVEVEAYRGADDPASHAFRGITDRTRVMFGEPGHAYVYFTYGNHYCLNVTTEIEGEPGAVLIRAAEPIGGLGEMRRRRGKEEVTSLMSGPGKLTQAMDIDLTFNGEDMVTSKILYFLAGRGAPTVASSTRIGLSSGADLEWRFYLEGSRFVSGPRTHNYRTDAAERRGVVG